jgi:hypothetical protein
MERFSQCRAQIPLDLASVAPLERVRQPQTLSYQSELSRGDISVVVIPSTFLRRKLKTRARVYLRPLFRARSYKIVSVSTAI